MAASDWRFDDAARLLGRDYLAAKTLLQEKASAASARGHFEEASVSVQIAARCPVDERDAPTLIARGHVRQVVADDASALEDFNKGIAVCLGCYQAYLILVLLCRIREFRSEFASDHF